MVAHHVAVGQCHVVLVELLCHLRRRRREVYSCAVNGSGCVLVLELLHTCCDVVDEAGAHSAGETVKLKGGGGGDQACEWKGGGGEGA